ncbi:phosphatidic acid phosphatase (PAP2) family protein [Actinidia rufa]|uniref:Fatty acyl-CoA reductase n=1 Tax=Actinidia rufa TaxID=165716 RepID=A0A7J0F4J6_9ERIC|nr:phosphatidic acid phosphatase (PAP2) family protein [Actinidia rufa]
MSLEQGSVVYCQSSGSAVKSIATSSVLTERSVLVDAGSLVLSTNWKNQHEIDVNDLVPFGGPNTSVLEMDDGIEIVKFLKGKSFLITSATGFLAKVLIEKILRTVPNVGKIFLLIKAESEEAAVQRLKNEIIDTELFKCLRQTYGKSYEAFMLSKLVPVLGNVCESNLGLEENTVDAITKEVDIIVNSAANTTFDERYDVTLDVNTGGPSRLMSLAKRGKKLKLFLQVSKEIVCSTFQATLIPECSTFQVPADMVVNATLAAIEKHGSAGKSESNVYQIASSVVNTLVFQDLASLLYQHLKSTPCLNSKGMLVHVPTMKLFGSMEDFSSHLWRDVVGWSGLSSLANGKLSQKLENICRKSVEQTKHLASIYQPYTFYGGRFDNSNTKRLMECMSEEEQQKFGFVRREREREEEMWSIPGWQVAFLGGIGSVIVISSMLNVTQKFRSLTQPWVTRHVVSSTPIILQIQRGWGSAMVLVTAPRAPRDLTESGLELVAKSLISTEKPFLSFLGISDSSARITPCGKPRMKDTEGDEQEDDWADQTMHWTRVEGDVPGEDISEQSLIEKACVEASERDYSGGTNERVPESHRKRSKEEAREEVSRRRSQRRDKKNCPRNKAQDQSSEAATTAMMAVDESDVLLAASADEESDWISDSGIAYHLCRDREWRNTQSFQGKQEKLQEKEDWKAIPTEGECPDRRAAVRHRSSVEQERKEMLWDTCESLARHEKVQPLQDVHEEAQRRETESMHNDRRDVARTSLFRSRSVAVISPVVHTREERWSHDDLQSDVLCRAPREVSDGGSLLLHCQEWGLYELSHELICSSLWPINSEDRQRREKTGAEKLRAPRAPRDLIESGLELVAKYQHNCLDAFFSVLSCVVSVPFYTAFLPLLFWSGHGKLARQMTILMAFCDYLGNCVKDVVSAPRPSCPPVRRVTATEDEKENAMEYGLPSSHTLNTVCLSGLFVGFTVVCLVVGLVALGRIYLGMHSLVDVYGGLTFGLAVLAFWLSIHDCIDEFVVSGENVASFWAILSFLLLFAYPTPEVPTPSFEYHTAFNVLHWEL